MSVGKITLLFLVVSAALWACDKGTPTRDQLAGVWEIQQQGMSGTLTLNADKTYTAVTNDGTLSGAWQVSEDRLTGTVADSTIPQLAAGYTWTSIIATVSASELTLRNRAGEIEEYRRVRR